MKLKALKESLEKALKEMRSLNESCVNEKGEIRSLSEDEQKRYSELEKSVQDIKISIERAEKLLESEKVLAGLEEVRDESPTVSIVREHNCNEAGECRVYRNDNFGFGEFLLDVRSASMSGGSVPKKLKELRAATGLNTGIGQEGGFLVQSDHADMLFSGMKDESAILSKCFEVVCSSESNSTTFNQIDETSLARGSVYGGVSASFVAEGGAGTASKPKFKKARVELEKLMALAYVTEEQLQDAAQTGSLIGEAFPKVMADEVVFHIFYGNGAGVPLGILNSGAAISVAKESGQAADTIVGANINKMVDRLLDANLSSTMWVAHPNTKAPLRSAHVAGTNSDKYLYADAGLFGNSQAQLAGYPVMISQNAKDLGDLGDLMLIDFSKYVLFRKTGLKASQSAHVAFLTDEMVFKWTYRVSGMPLMNNALTDRHGSTTRSPFILLAERA